MRDQQQRRAEPRVLLEQMVDDRLAGGAVEIAGRLVGQQQRRAGDEGARDRDALLLAARQLAGIVPQAMPEPDPSQRRLGQREGVAMPSQFERDRDVLARRHRRQQVKALEHDPDMTPPQPRQPAFVEAAQVLPGHDDPPGARPLDAGDDHHQARLARSRRADQRDRLAGRDGERDAAQDLDRPGRPLQCQADLVEQDERVAHR